METLFFTELILQSVVFWYYKFSWNKKHPKVMNGHIPLELGRMEFMKTE